MDKHTGNVRGNRGNLIYTFGYYINENIWEVGEIHDNNFISDLTEIKTEEGEIMTLGDFLKRVDKENDQHKMMIWYEGKGWTNINVNVTEHEIKLTASCNSPFSDEK